jgi:hypothetical protein
MDTSFVRKDRWQLVARQKLPYVNIYHASTVLLPIKKILNIDKYYVCESSSSSSSSSRIQTHNVSDDSLCLTILNHFRQMLVVFKYFVGSDWQKSFKTFVHGTTVIFGHFVMICMHKNGNYTKYLLIGTLWKNIKKRRFVYMATGTRGQNIFTFFPTLRNKI